MNIFKNTYSILLILWLTFLGCDNGKKTVENINTNLQKADWSSFQEILDIGIVTNPYTGTYGNFNHNAFDYEKLLNHKSYKILVDKQIKNLSLAKAPEERKAKLAFWINAYNFFTIVDVCSSYPIKSMKDIGWKNTIHQVGNTKFSLDHIEHSILRLMNEPKIHFALNCASVSCPSLFNKVFKEDSIIDDLTKLTEDAFKNPLHIQNNGNGVNVTKLMDWFEKDFVIAPYNSTTRFVEAYSPEELRKPVTDYIDYDWDLNSPTNISNAMKKLNIQKEK